MTLDQFIQRPSPILLDGAMGTQLAAMGLEMGGQNNCSHPEAVLAIHRQYVESGAEVLITNTLTMNRISIASHGVGVDVREANLTGARLARAAGDGRFVLGDISSTGQMLEPYGDYTEAQFEETFRGQAQLLAEGGVDGFIVETMIDLREALCAVHACRAVAPLPVLASLSFQTVENGGRTVMGNAAAESARTLFEAGASAVGANCGNLDPFQIATIVAMMREAVTIPILAQPNAGCPRLEGGKTHFDMAPDDFAAGIAACLRAGATLVGDCCGTTPTHIRKIREMLNTDQPFDHTAI